MRAGYWIVGLLIAGFGVYHFMHAGKPSASEVEPLLRSYLESQCNGDSEINQLDDVRVGSYTRELGGWAVYANHVETCTHHGSSDSDDNATSETYQGGHDAERNISVAMVRRNASGELEIYEPEFVEAAKRQMQQAFDHAFDNVKTN